MIEKKIKGTTVKLVKGDITDMEVEAFVFYASPDLKLGTGYGTAIALRGGQTIQKELDQKGGAKVGESVLTDGGEMKAGKIIHAVGPRFQEDDTEGKLVQTIRSALKVAEENGITQVAFPPMGAGFFGVPLPACAKIMSRTIAEALKGDTTLKEVIICALDNREYTPFVPEIEALARA